MVRAQLAHRDDRYWVDVLPGVMLLFNEMEQEKRWAFGVPNHVGTRNESTK